MFNTEGFSQSTTTTNLTSDSNRIDGNVSEKQRSIPRTEDVSTRADGKSFNIRYSSKAQRGAVSLTIVLDVKKEKSKEIYSRINKKLEVK